MTTPRQERLQTRLAPEIQQFRQDRQCVLLATVDTAGRPNVSYAPFVLVDGHYYVLISEIARHARNLQQVPRASMMMIADEAESREIFARQRLTFDVTAERVARDDAQWSSVVSALKLRHGERITDLTQMTDFILFRLLPEQGLYVKGFGQAFQVSGDDHIDMVHLQEGHKMTSEPA